MVRSVRGMASGWRGGERTARVPAPAMPKASKEKRYLDPIRCYLPGTILLMLIQCERGSAAARYGYERVLMLSPIRRSPTKIASPTSLSSAQEQEHKIVACDSSSKVVDYEFGGPWGVSALMIGFPLLMSYLYICLAANHGHLENPLRWDFWMGGIPTIIPTQRATAIYVLFNIFQYVTAATMPGIKVMGIPVPSLGGKQLEYLCNGVATWYLDLVVAACLHISGWFPITNIVDEIGPITTVAMIWGVIVTIITYVVALTLDQTHRMTGSIPYDMFMGVILNPRLGNVDLKMWSEIRIPWKILFFISVSAAVKDHEINIERDLLAGITPEVWSFAGGLIQMYKIQTSSTLLFMLLAHFLYANACMKGEVSGTIMSVTDNW